ncbi:hypothetical protein DICVIV_13863 [Dictyocaulus viviparus]|uniref:Uncharacterized protein n=1 Tax=Dictyocaulus viviparus TaxID=29172 RepID=A0A0D8X6S0_DICVI|nr:hypothetical protein DICVIV_13863 [Dictyocaulus viviparus]
MHLFNLPKVICDPFRRQFDYNRCIKILFIEPLDILGSSKRILTPSSEDSKLAAKIAADEMALEKLLAEKEKEDKKKVR